jgi:hypothetical protein
MEHCRPNPVDTFAYSSQTLFSEPSSETLFSKQKLLGVLEARESQGALVLSFTQPVGNWQTRQAYRRTDARGGALAICCVRKREVEPALLLPSILRVLAHEINLSHFSS